tara:strand:- start:3169 stop:3366 length:198 start_codon:yes stop_codon:yes gene_type:complete
MPYIKRDKIKKILEWYNKGWETGTIQDLYEDLYFYAEQYLKTLPRETIDADYEQAKEELKEYYNG